MKKAKEYAPEPDIEAELFSGRGHTTHFSIIDKDGNCVAQTQTVGDLFGSGVLVEGCGFVMNSLMMDSSPKLGKIAGTDKKYENVNCVQPGKMPLSSNCPTIILKDGEPVMITGAAGGPRIIVGTIQCIVNAIEFGMPVDAALRAPAIGGFTKEGGLEIEPGVSPDTIALLKAKGHKVTQGAMDSVLGFVSNAILCKGGEAYPANCYRIDGCGGAILGDGSYVFEGARFES
jgi:gamma-glutamyltranspeptidase/glutathione hydrolase